ncbi:MAG: hypothetical protein HC918_10185 [Oscillatoriales cyanobacterium SM2_1_8]|nr:hypothetical protein [Oscillatoriales cyanobacterium SM2_1_8]
MLVRESIVAFLDQAFQAIEMPWFDNLNIDYLGFRLLVYRAADHWRLVFSSVVWCPAADGLMAMVEPVGPGVDVAPDRLYTFTPVRLTFASAKGTGEGAGEAAIDALNAPEGNEIWQRLTVRGETVNVSALDVQPQYDLQPEYGFWVGAALVSQDPEPLFANASELAGCVPPDFQHLLTVSAWDHPTWERPPSQTEAFPRLAEVLIAADPTLWQPVATPNTHWARWLPK